MNAGPQNLTPDSDLPGPRSLYGFTTERVIVAYGSRDEVRHRCIACGWTTVYPSLVDLSHHRRTCEAVGEAP